MVNAQRLTGTLNWFNEIHKVKVQSNSRFDVSSEGRVTDEGFSAKQFFEKKAKEREKQFEERRMSECINDIIEQMEHVVREAQIFGKSEHTITFIGTDIDKKHLGYLQLPVLIRGLEKKSREKVKFT